MRKKILKSDKISAFIISMLLVFSIALSQPLGTIYAAETNTMPLRGVWFSFLDWQKYLSYDNVKSFDSSFSTVCDNVISHNINCIFVHVRSHNDAVYSSSIYPWSTQMLGGMDPGFDPLAEMVTIAHQKGLSFHAWINPYGYRNGKIDGNPALATTDNVIAGVNEIITRYNVDGIHFDDYFPPIGKEETNKMVAGVHSVCAQHKKVFGISPLGNLAKLRASSADVDTWLSTPGYIDYLAPQLYWSDFYGPNANERMFSNRLAQFTSIDTAHIPIFVGLAAYKTNANIKNDPGWMMYNANLLYQRNQAQQAGCLGYILYSYAALISPGSQSEIVQLQAAK